MIYRVFHVISTGRLHLCFFNEALNSYRDIKLAIYPKEHGDENLAVQRKMNLLLANLLQLREELDLTTC